MLSEKQLEIISEALIPLFNYLETEIISDICRRVSKTMTYTRTAELQAMAMRELGYSPAKIRSEAMKLLNADSKYRKAVAKNTMEYKRQVRKIINEITKEAYKANNEIVANAGNMSWVSDLSVWKDAGRTLLDKSFLAELTEAFARQTAGELKNLTRTTGFKTMSGYEAVENAYKRELDKAVIKICSGTFSQEKVLQDTVKELAKSGLRSIDFASGRSVQLDTAVRTALRTGCHQLAGKILDKNIEETGVNLAYVSNHWGARNTGTGHANHEQWQGKVYFIKAGTDYTEEIKRIGQKDITDLWEATGYSVDGLHENDPLGLNGYNYRHNHYARFEGVSTFPDEQPEPKPVTINGKTYDYYAMTQKMRSMERAIRALKRERDALGTLGMDTKEIAAEIKQKGSEYEEFCRMCHVPEATSRTWYQSSTSDLKKTKAWKAYEKCEFENELKAKTLGASDKIGNGNEPVRIGQIDVAKKETAVKYFGNQIRDSEIEKLVVIDKAGNVYYNEGVNDTVSAGTLDLNDCIVLHNHPKSNGIVSFGEDDFLIMRDYQSASFRLVNEKYDYLAEIIKPLDGVTYNQVYRWTVEYMEKFRNVKGEFQHLSMEALKERGYIRYERKRIIRKPNKQD